jgi:hypothetical protein
MRGIGWAYLVGSHKLPTGANNYFVQSDGTLTLLKLRLRDWLPGLFYNNQQMAALRSEMQEFQRPLTQVEHDLRKNQQ